MPANVFVTDTGTEVPAVTVEQMRDIDRVAVEDVGPTLHQMMENAGRNLALTVMETAPDEWMSTPIVVLAGSGGNGGGGICAARHLANRGADVTIVVTDPDRLAPVPADHLRVYRATDGREAGMSEVPGLEAGVVVDTIIGYSLGGAPRGAALEMIEWVGEQPAPVVALDVPSGVHAGSGSAPGAFVEAATTLTLALPKTGLDAAPAGALLLGDIGIPTGVYRRVGIDVPVDLFGRRFRVPIRPG